MSAQPPSTPIEAPTRSLNPLQLLADRSLRTKLILAFLGVTALSVGAVAFFAIRTMQVALTTEVA
jgi:hypothetical protein